MTPMDADTLRALKASIKHWKENAAAKTPRKVKTGPDACALCLKFQIRSGSCSRCPVALRTGEPFCEGSPWGRAVHALNAWGMNPGDAGFEDMFRAAAYVEVDFLESLVPPGQRDDEPQRSEPEAQRG